MAVILYLTNKDQLICKAIEHDTHFEISNPIQIFIVPDQATGQMKMGMAEFLPHCQKDMVVFKSAVAVVAIPDVQLANQYAEITGDIILPNTQIITG